MAQHQNQIWNDAEITTGQRPVKDGSAYAQYFPTANGKDKIIIRNGSVEDTVALMKRVVWTYKDDTETLAKTLRRRTTEATCRAIWQFIYDFLQYKLDEEGLEQLRRPARSWQERGTGVDCDCMSIFASSLLTNLQIPHSFRIAKYSRPTWQHVYVIVPDGNDYITVDGVLGRFNYEKSYSQKQDFPMDLNGINIAVLSGFGDTAREEMLSHSIYENAIMGTALLGAAEQADLSGDSAAALDHATLQYLQHTRAVAAANPMMLVAAGDKNPAAFIEMLDYAIRHWHHPQRNAALGLLIQNENEMNRINGFDESWMQRVDEDTLRGDEDLYFADHLGSLGKAKKDKSTKKGFFKKVGSAIKNHVVRMNPLTIAARNGFLLALKLNIGRISEKIKWGYATPEQAGAKGIPPATVQRAKNAIAKIEKLFVKIGGKSDNLRKAVLKSKHGKLSGLGYTDIMYGLGETLGVAPVAAALAAAIPVITAVLKIIKDSGLVKPGEQQTMQPSEDETPALPAQEAEGNLFDKQPAISVPAVAESSEPQEGFGSVATTVKDFFTNNPIVATAGAAIAAFVLYNTFSDGRPAPHSRKAKGLGAASRRSKPMRFVLK